MPDTLKITMQNDATLIAKLRAAGPRIIQVITNKMNALMFLLEGKIKSEKLSGQVLQRRSGILSGSVRAIPAALEGTNIVGGVTAGGGAAMYASVQEYGGTHAYPVFAVKARALAFLMDGKQVFAKRVMHPPLPARSYMRSSLEENSAKIKSELQQSILDSLNE
jgi:hypothetical protein